MVDYHLFSHPNQSAVVPKQSCLITVILNAIYHPDTTCPYPLLSQRTLSSSELLK